MYLFKIQKLTFHINDIYMYIVVQTHYWLSRRYCRRSGGMDWSAEMFICSLSILDFTIMNQLVSTQPFYFICYVTKQAFNPQWAGLIASWIRILKCYKIKYLHQTWWRMLKVSEGKPVSLSVLPHFPIVSLDKPLVCVCVRVCPRGLR